MRRASASRLVTTALLVAYINNGLTLTDVYKSIAERFTIGKLSSLEEIEIREAYLLIKTQKTRQRGDLEDTDV